MNIGLVTMAIYMYNMLNTNKLQRNRDIFVYTLYILIL